MSGIATISGRPTDLRKGAGGKGGIKAAGAAPTKAASKPGAVRASNPSSVSNFIGNHALTIGGGAVAGAIATYLFSQQPTEHTHEVDEDGDEDDDKDEVNDSDDDDEDDDDLTESDLHTIQATHPNIYHKIVQARTKQTARAARLPTRFLEKVVDREPHLTEDSRLARRTVAIKKPASKA
jgi:hypothetical protein